MGLKDLHENKPTRPAVLDKNEPLDAGAAALTVARLHSGNSILKDGLPGH